MIAQGFHHIGHTASAMSAVLHLPERSRTVAPALLTLAGFTPVQVEVLIGGFLVTMHEIDFVLRRIKSHLPKSAPTRQDGGRSPSIH